MNIAISIACNIKSCCIKYIFLVHFVFEIIYFILEYFHIFFINDYTA